MREKESAITMKEFVEKLVAGGGSNPSPAGCVEYGLQQGWLEKQDATNPEQHLLRKHAARIIHNFLRLEQNEADEIDGSPAYVMRDLFDCRVCAGHIIQVYIKGIMEGVTLPDGRLVFAAEEMVSVDDAEEIVIRVFQTERRVRSKAGVFHDSIVSETVELSLENAMKVLQKEKGYYWWMFALRGIMKRNI